MMALADQRHIAKSVPTASARNTQAPQQVWAHGVSPQASTVAFASAVPAERVAQESTRSAQICVLETRSTP